MKETFSIAAVFAGAIMLLCSCKMDINEDDISNINIEGKYTVADIFVIDNPYRLLGIDDSERWFRYTPRFRNHDFERKTMKSFKGVPVELSISEDMLVLSSNPINALTEELKEIAFPLTQDGRDILLIDEEDIEVTAESVKKTYYGYGLRGQGADLINTDPSTYHKFMCSDFQECSATIIYERNFLGRLKMQPKIILTGRIYHRGQMQEEYGRFNNTDVSYSFQATLTKL